MSNQQKSGTGPAQFVGFICGEILAFTFVERVSLAVYRPDDPNLRAFKLSVLVDREQLDTDVAGVELLLKPDRVLATLADLALQAYGDQLVSELNHKLNAIRGRRFTK